MRRRWIGLATVIVVLVAGSAWLGYRYVYDPCERFMTKVCEGMPFEPHDCMGFLGALREYKVSAKECRAALSALEDDLAANPRETEALSIHAYLMLLQPHVEAAMERGSLP